MSQGGLSYEKGAETAKRLIQKNKKITVLFSFNDINALGAIRGLNDIGLKVPGDVSVMGIDDIIISSIFIPSLTIISYPVKEMVDEASKILLNRIKKPVSNKNKEIIIKPELIIREPISSINKI